MFEQRSLVLDGGRRIETPLGWYEPTWADFELHLAIDFAPFTVERKRGKRKGETYTVTPVISWKRAHQVVTVMGHSSIGLTTEAKTWARTAAAHLAAQWACVGCPIPRDVEINAAIRSYLPTRRLADSSNLYQGPEDVLKGHQPKCKPDCDRHAGVLEDDVSIRSPDGSDRLYDPKRPRVEILLIPYRRRHEVHQLIHRRSP